MSTRTDIPEQPVGQKRAAIAAAKRRLYQRIKASGGSIVNAAVTAEQLALLDRVSSAQFRRHSRNMAVGVVLQAVLDGMETGVVQLPLCSDGAGVQLTLSLR